MLTMLQLSLRQMSGRRRIVLIVILATLPVALAGTLRVFGGLSDPNEVSGFVDTVVDGMIIATIMPIVVMTLATAAFGDELEDRTLNLLVLKPISRMAIVLPKLVAVIAIAAPLAAATGIAVSMLAFEDMQASLATGAAVFVGAVAYAAVFTWAGLMSSRAIGFALVYVLLWEGLLSSFLSGIRYLSIRGYTLGILNGLDETAFKSISSRVIEFPAAVVGAALVTIVFTWLTVRRLQRMDVQ
jgi:ABC-2 type transport system permease protein